MIPAVMPGRIKSLIDAVMERRAGKNEALRHFVRSHLILKGINPDRYDESSPDDPEIISRLEAMLEEYK